MGRTMNKLVLIRAINLTHVSRGIFRMSAKLYELLRSPEHVLLYISDDNNYIKIKKCGENNLDGNRVASVNHILSCCELRNIVDFQESQKIQAYEYANGGGVILKIGKSPNCPKNFKLVKKETKLFVASVGNTADNRNRFRMSMELYRRLKLPKFVNLRVGVHKKRLYISRSNSKVGAYPIIFTKTTKNSGFASFSVFNLRDELGVEVNERVKYQVKTDSLGRHYMDLHYGIVEKNSKGQ